MSDAQQNKMKPCDCADGTWCYHCRPAFYQGVNKFTSLGDESPHWKTIRDLQAKLVAAEARGQTYLEALVHIEDAAQMVVRQTEVKEVTGE